MSLDELIDIVADVLDIDPASVEPDTQFVDDLGADSLDLFQIISEVESRYNIEVSDENMLEHILTVEDALNVINDNI